MAVSIRLARQGSKKRPYYRIVAANRRSPRDGRFIEQIGYYDPRRKEFRVDKERYQRWVDNGALASATVATLVKRYAGADRASAPAGARS
jgi:small subunit ribosomal protein S16